MAQTIKLKRSGTQNAVPTTSQLALGEVALNTYDGKMYIKKSVGGTESIVEIGGDATSSSGLDFTGNLNLADNVRIVIGDGNDLQIYHDGSDSYITDGGTGNLKIQADDLVFKTADGSKEYLKGTASGSVRIRHNNSIKFETTSTGATVTGTLAADQLKVGPTERIYLDGGSNTFIVEDAADDLGIYVGGSRRLRVNTARTVAAGDLQVAGGDIEFNQSSGQARLRNLLQDTYMRFSVNVGGTNTNAINIRGNNAYVGIGSAEGGNSPVYPLDVYNAGADTVARFTSGDNKARLLIADNDTEAFVIAENSKMSLGLNSSSSTTNLTIDSTGQVGVGTTSPSRQLHVLRSGTTSAIMIEAGDGNQSSVDLKNTEGWFRLINDGGSLSVYDQSDSAERFRINTSGNFEFSNGNFTEVGTISSGAITTSSSLNFTNNPATIQNSEDNSGQIIIQAKNSSGDFYGVRWDVANASTGALRPSHNNNSNLGLTNRIWNTLYVNNIRMGSNNDQFVDANRNINAGNITATGFLRGPSTFTIDPSAHGDNTGTVVIAGNLQVDGTTTTINSTTLTVDDKNITLASGAANAAAASGAGITVDTVGAQLTYDATQDRWNMNKGLELLGTPLVVGTGATDVGRVENSSGVFSLTAYSGRQIAFGNDTNGEHVRVDANGNVGIGTTSPAHKLHVSAGSTNGNIIARLEQGTTAGNYSALQVGRTDGSGNVHLADVASGGVPIGGIAGILLGSNNTSLPAVAIRTPNSAAGHIVFKPKDTEAVRITSDGKVGIGITDPATNLHISSTDSSTLTIQNSTNAGNASLHFRDESNVDQYKVFYDLPNNRAEQHFNGNGLRFYSNQISAEVAKIGFGNGYNSSYFAGRVGMGTTSPVAKLHVQENTSVTYDATAYQHDLFLEKRNTGGANQTTGLRFAVTGYDGSTTAEASIGILQTSNAHSGNLVFGTRHSGTRAERMRITSDGNVGIGEASPDRRLHVKDSTLVVSKFESSNSGGVLLDLENAAVPASHAGAYAGIRFYNSSGFDMALSHITESTGNGYVQIGESWDGTSTIFKAHSSGAVTFNDAFTFPTTDGSANQILKTDGSGNVTWATEAAVSANTSISDADGDTKIQVEESSDDDTIRFDTAGSQRMLINASGNVGINNASPSKTLSVGGTFQSTGEAFFSHFDNTTSSSRMRDNLRLNFGTARTFAILGNSTNMHIRNSNTDVMTFDTSNRVGIGNTSPGYTLDVSGQIHSTAAYIDGYIYHTGDSDTYIQYSTDTIILSAGAQQTYFKGNGRVGIGTTDPAAPLHLKGTGDTTLIVEADSDNSGETDNARIELRQDGNNVAGYLYTEGNAGQTATGTLANTTVLESKGGGNDVGIHFATGGRAPAQSGGELAGTVRMTILGSGDVGIGTTTPDEFSIGGSYRYLAVGGDKHRYYKSY